MTRMHPKHVAGKRLRRLKPRSARAGSEWNCLDAAFEQAAVGFALLALDGGWLRVNERLVEILGYGQSELRQLRLQDLVHPDDRDVTVASLAQLSSGGTSKCTKERRCIRKDGQTVWVTFGVSVVRTPDGQPEYLIAVVEDIHSRKQAEEGLRKFSRVIEQSASAVIITDTNGIIEYVNPAFTEISGYNAVDVIGMKPSILKSGHTAAQDYEQLWRTIKAGKVWYGEFQNRRKNGTLYWESAIISPIRNDDGQISHFAGIKENITAKKMAEAAQRASEARLQLLMDHAPAALAMFDREMRYLAVSRRWLADYGLEGHDILGVSHYVVFPEVTDAWRAVHRRGLAGEVIRTEEDRFERLNGNVQWLRWEVRPWFTSDNAVGGIVIFTEDISARKEAAAALAVQNAQYQAAIETAPDGYWMLNERGHLLTVNDAYVRSSGYSREELLAMDIGALEASESPEEVQAHIQRVKLTGSDCFETLHRAKDGEIWPVEVSCSYSAAAGGHHFAFIRDISERERNETALRALRRELEQMLTLQVASQTAAAIAHELNQPLNAVAAYSEAAMRMLQQTSPAPERLQHALARSMEQAQRAGRVVRELIAFLHKGDAPKEAVDLNKAVRRALRFVESIGIGGFEPIVDLAPGLPPVLANRVQVDKILIVLIQNAVEAMLGAAVPQPVVTVRVRTHAEPDMALLSVEDCGPGMDEAILRRVFDPFFTTKPYGLGMGLAITRHLVEAHGGTIWVESALGARTTFHFTLLYAK
ncbi:MAG: PAS domain S-box protein [Proteobacteria bacterium]|nr:PAS domain S-box protein [Pseudomonadota bacterium]